jgi:hypothetical protein
MTTQDQAQKVPAATRIGTVSEAAAKAAEAFAQDEFEKHAEAMGQAWEAKLLAQTQQYTRHAMELARTLRLSGGDGTEEPELAEPIALPPGLPPYPWWNVLLAGPFQPGIAPAPSLPPGPYLPHKIIAFNEPSFMIAAAWRNPAGIDWNGTNPSASVVMGAFNLSISFETVNLTSVTNGPDFGPFTFAPLGPGVVNRWILPFPPNTFPAPLQGRPNLYEMNMTADVSGPIAGLPFAGFATWVYDPDREPPIWPPPLPFPLPPPWPPIPPQPWFWSSLPHWQFERPARFMVYRR